MMKLRNQEVKNFVRVTSKLGAELRFKFRFV